VDDKGIKSAAKEKWLHKLTSAFIRLELKTYFVAGKKCADRDV
jgi:hypothetical protein